MMNKRNVDRVLEVKRIFRVSYRTFEPRDAFGG